MYASISSLVLSQKFANQTRAITFMMSIPSKGSNPTL